MPYNRPIPDAKNGGSAAGLFKALVEAEKLIQVALILPCAVFIGWLAGDWVGGRLHQPWLIAVGVVLGGAAGLVYVIRLAMHALNASANNHEDSSGKGTNGKRL